MTPGLVLGMNLKCPQITFGVKNPCGMTFLEHILRAAGFSQMIHPNSVNSAVPSFMNRVHGQTSNWDQNIFSIPNFRNQALHIPTLLLNIIQCGNGLVVYATLKNPYFYPSHISEASEIFLSLILKNDPCLKNGILKLFLCNFWPRNKCYHLI